ncbi:MAG: putative metal-binding motif-containing protein, partial [Myxococcales bacterium]|nr:putative metal-binding motif-containing protein [Myxococcales bacterium]
NGLDDDCDTVVDDGTTDVQWYVDGDGDGVGSAPGLFQCNPPAGQVSIAGDCNDANPAIRPGADEVCDAVDNDCDGTIDLGASDASTWFYDLDEDGYGATSSATLACTAPSGAVAASGDCDDGNDAVNPGATEVCNGVDDNCDGQVDLDAPSPTLWYADADADGFGDENGTPLAQCAQPSGYVTDATDCDDTSFDTNPDALEQCDSIDHDCDGVLDNDTMDRQYYLDTDGDGYGSTVLGHFGCAAL